MIKQILLYLYALCKKKTILSKYYTRSRTALHIAGLNTYGYASLSTKIAKPKMLTLRECQSPVPQSKNVE